MVEQILEDYGRAYGIRFVNLRYFNAGGADWKNGLGERRAVETHLIPVALDAAAGKRKSIRIFGADYPTPDGTCARDYIHVEDLAEGHWKALEHLESSGESLTLNLGSGVGYSVREVVATVREVTGREFLVEVAPRRPGDPAWLVADPGKVKDLWGWQPRRSSLGNIVESAWRWRRSGMGLLQPA
jgi:UDP-glucose 4-epimerase